MLDILEEDSQPRVVLVEGWRRRAKLNDYSLDRNGKAKGIVQRVIDTARRRKVDCLILEDKMLGKAVKDEVIRQTWNENWQIHLFDPRKYGDKTGRLNSVQPLFAQKLVFAPGNCIIRVDKQGVPYTEIEELAWVRRIMDEVAAVPGGRFDDYADCVSMSLLYLRENGFLALTQEHIENTMRARTWKPKPFNVAANYMGP